MAKMKITCEEATTICTKSQYGEASLIDKIKLNLHFLYCKTCRLFSKQNNKLSDMCNLAKQHGEKKKCSLSMEEKNQWKEEMKGLDKSEH